MELVKPCASSLRRHGYDPKKKKEWMVVFEEVAVFHWEFGMKMSFFAYGSFISIGKIEFRLKY